MGEGREREREREREGERERERAISKLFLPRDEVDSDDMMCFNFTKIM